MYIIWAKFNSIDGLTFQSESSFYKKLVSATEFDYEYWAAKCHGEPIPFIFLMVCARAWIQFDHMITI